MQGREPGTPGSKSAIGYIEKQWKKSGISPAGIRGFRQQFQFNSGVTISGYNRLKINESRQIYKVKKDFIPLGFSKTGSFSAPVVFVGYGFDIQDSIQWNDYAGVDVMGRWVMIFRGSPDGSGPHSLYADHMSIRKKYLLAEDKGAAGVLFVNPYGDDELTGFIDLTLDPSASAGYITVIHISQALAGQLFPNENELLLLQKKIDASKKPASVLLNKTVSATVGLKINKTTGTNLIGRVKGTDATDETIVIGAHMDHLGYGGKGSGSLSAETNAIHNGADDNASGTAGLIEIAEQIGKHPLRKNVLFIAFDAEEKGLLGSKYFVEHPTLNLKNIISMVNLDMIGRMKDSSLTIGGVGTSPVFQPLLDSLNDQKILKLTYSNEGYGPSDHSSFYAQDIPVLFFFTGTHEDYHKPGDDWEKINTIGIAQVVELVEDVVVTISQEHEPPKFTEAGPKEAPKGNRHFKVTFGIIPSYGSGGDGLKLDGVRSDGPARVAGLLKGDVIIEINGNKIKDIYDYMLRLGDLKKGQRIPVKVLRNKENLEFFIQL